MASPASTDVGASIPVISVLPSNLVPAGRRLQNTAVTVVVPRIAASRRLRTIRPQVMCALPVIAAGNTSRTPSISQLTRAVP